MTKAEFTAWTSVTSASRLSWRIDRSRWNRNRELLFYFGNQDGKFICIYPDGMLHAGIYEGACPNLMEATFQPTFTKKFVTREDAYKRVVECGGIQFVCKQLVDSVA
jgi:hypothetical protein